MAWTEARIVRDRINRELASQATLTQAAVSGLLNEKAAKRFAELVKELME